MAQFESSVSLNCSQETVFEFLARPSNLLKILPENSGMTYISVPERLELGSRIEFQLAGIGPVQRFLHEVTEFDDPRRFVERQVKGPLQAWLHEHVVEHNGDGETLVIDRIAFEPPGGLAGFLVTEAKILEMLHIGFDHRHREMKKLLEGA